MGIWYKISINGGDMEITEEMAKFEVKILKMS